MTEEEWLKRQEALERRRMRSLRDKREAEETVKAKIRKAVTARFRGKLGTGGESGTEGEAGAKEAGEKQVGARGRAAVGWTWSCAWLSVHMTHHDSLSTVPARQG